MKTVKKSKIFVVGLGCCIVIIFLFYNISHHFRSTSKEVQLGISMLEQEQNKSVSDAQKHIKEVENELKKEKNKEANISMASFKNRYQNSVILGDSIAEAILDYRILPKNNVLAIRGRRTDNSQDEINMAISLVPNNVFLCYGMNDLPYCRGNEKRFIEQYKSMILQLKNALPSTRIYVNSIVPMTKKGYQSGKYNKKDKTFNEAMKRMCKELGVVYLDNDYLIDGNASDYECDGIHPKYNFYPKWLNYMAQSAGI